MVQTFILRHLAEREYCSSPILIAATSFPSAQCRSFLQRTSTDLRKARNTLLPIPQKISSTILLKMLTETEKELCALHTEALHFSESLSQMVTHSTFSPISCMNTTLAKRTKMRALSRIWITLSVWSGERSILTP